MKIRRKLKLLGLSAAIINVGYSSLLFGQAFAQSSTITFTQSITCGQINAAFVSVPTSFNFPTKIASLNFDTNFTTYTVADIQLTADSPVGCSGHGVTLYITSNQFISAGATHMVTTATSGKVYAAHFGISFSAPTCTGTCTPYSGFTVGTDIFQAGYPTHAFVAGAIPGNLAAGDYNLFSACDRSQYTTTSACNAGQYPFGTLQADDENVFDNVLTPSLKVNVLNNAVWNGTLTIPNVHYYIALPGGLPIGSYNSTVTWTLSTN